MKPLQAVRDVKLKICLLSDCVLTLEYECEHDATSVIVELKPVYSCVFPPHLSQYCISEWIFVHFIGEIST